MVVSAEAAAAKGLRPHFHALYDVPGPLRVASPRSLASPSGLSDLQARYCGSGAGSSRAPSTPACAGASYLAVAVRALLDAFGSLLEHLFARMLLVPPFARLLARECSPFSDGAAGGGWARLLAGSDGVGNLGGRGFGGRCGVGMDPGQGLGGSKGGGCVGVGGAWGYGGGGLATGPLSAAVAHTMANGRCASARVRPEVGVRRCDYLPLLPNGCTLKRAASSSSAPSAPAAAPAATGSASAAAAPMSRIAESSEPRPRQEREVADGGSRQRGDRRSAFPPLPH